MESIQRYNEDDIRNIKEEDIVKFLMTFRKAFTQLEQNIEDSLHPVVKWRAGESVQDYGQGVTFKYHLEVGFEYPGKYYKPFIRIHGYREKDGEHDWGGVYLKLQNDLIGSMWLTQEGDFAMRNIVTGNTSLPHEFEGSPNGYGKVKDYIHLGRPLSWLEEQEQAFLDAFKQESQSVMEEAVWGCNAPAYWSNIIEDPNTEKE